MQSHFTPPAKTRIKICGTTNLADALLAAEAGADALGVIFAPISKRLVSPQVARDISLSVGPCVGRVGVFLDQPLTEVLRLADAARVSAVQLHAPTDPTQSDDEFLELLAEVAQYYPVLRVLRPQELSILSAAPAPRTTLMLDAPTPGSGEPLDWSALAAQFPVGAWLAGGLGPHNVAEAIAALRPAGVDAVSQLEAAAGRKDPHKVRAFMAAVRQADTLLS